MSLQPSYINLDTLHEYCKGDSDKKRRYLTQFLELIPLSMQKLKTHIKEKDRNKLLKEIHFMSPQLVFFGIEDFSDLLKRDKVTEQLSFEEIESQVLEGISTIEKALIEVREIIDNQSKGISI